MRFGGAVLLAASLSVATPAGADENSDLNLIPGSAQQAPTEAPATPANGRLFLENAFSLFAPRGLAVPLPPPPAPLWQNRTSFDATWQWNLTPTLSANLSDRFNLTELNGEDFPSHQNLRNDFREGYLTWEPATRAYVEAGRINVRNGVALGFNPTDFFKTRTLLDQASLDPSVIRLDRLGVLMLRAQAIWDRGSASIAFAPKVQRPLPLGATGASGFDPRFDRTNAADRLLLSVNYDFADLAPQALVYHEGNETHVGVNLSHTIGQSVVAYAEWAGGQQPNLITEAVRFGKLTGTLPANAPLLPPTSNRVSFQNQLAIGASWTSEAKITLNLEYHYNQSGFSRADWRNWFAIGGARGAPLPVTGELWYIRGFAADQQEPIAQHQAFLRADWTDAFITNLELSAFSFINLTDGSSLSQLSASYYLSSAWTIGAYATTTFGGPHSERGSLPEARSFILQAVRYF